MPPAVVLYSLILRHIVAEVAALALGAQVFRFVVTWIPVQVGSGDHHFRKAVEFQPAGAECSGRYYAFAGFLYLIHPDPVDQVGALLHRPAGAPDHLEVGRSAILAAPAGSAADLEGYLFPVRRIEVLLDGH